MCVEANFAKITKAAILRIVAAENDDKERDPQFSWILESTLDYVWYIATHIGSEVV